MTFLLNSIPSGEARPAILSGPLGLATLTSMVLLVPTLLLLVLDQRILDDELLWLKPLKFQISMAFLTVTLALAIQSSPPALQSSLWLRLPAMAVAATAIFELAFLAIQAGRGKRSHFNAETLFDQIGGSLMAAGASVLVGGAMVIGIVILVATLARGHAAISEPVTLSVGLGLIIGGFLGGYTGSFIGMNAGPFVGPHLASDPVVPLFGWSQSVGDLRIAHFLGLHAMQVLPILAIGLLLMLSPAAATAVIVAASAGWVWLTLAALYAAQAGKPPFFL